MSTVMEEILDYLSIQAVPKDIGIILRQDESVCKIQLDPPFIYLKFDSCEVILNAESYKHGWDIAGIIDKEENGEDICMQSELDAIDGEWFDRIDG